MVQLAAVYAIILPQAQRSIVCSENLPSPQIRMHDHAYVQIHKHMQTRRGTARTEVGIIMASDPRRKHVT